MAQEVAGSSPVYHPIFFVIFRRFELKIKSPAFFYHSCLFYQFLHFSDRKCHISATQNQPVCHIEKNENFFNRTFLFIRLTSSRTFRFFRIVTDLPLVFCDVFPMVGALSFATLYYWNNITTVDRSQFRGSDDTTACLIIIL